MLTPILLNSKNVSDRRKLFRGEKNILNIFSGRSQVFADVHNLNRHRYNTTAIPRPLHLRRHTEVLFITATRDINALSYIHAGCSILRVSTGSADGKLNDAFATTKPQPTAGVFKTCVVTVHSCIYSSIARIATKNLRINVKRQVRSIYRELTALDTLVHTLYILKMAVSNCRKCTIVSSFVASSIFNNLFCFLFVLFTLAAAYWTIVRH